MAETPVVVPARLKDRVLLPGDAHYETARLVDNAANDPGNLFRSNLNIRP